MNSVMYLIANKSVEMSKGKFAAQAAHAAVEAFRAAQANAAKERTVVREDWSGSQQLIDAWLEGGHYTKIVLEADDLGVAERYLNDRGFHPVLIIDEGRTEFDGRLTPTFLGILVDKDDEHTAATFSTFKLFKEPKPPKPTQRKKQGFNIIRWLKA